MNATPVPLAHDIHGPGGAPTVLLAPSLGTTLSLWDHLTHTLARRYRVVRFDLRGHGASPVAPGPYSMEALADDVVGLTDSLDVERFAVVGLSIGGAIGQILALRHPERLTALVLCCTGPAIGEPSGWHERARRVRAEGMGWLVEPTRGRWFTQDFLASHPDEASRLLRMIAGIEPEGYAACCDALAAYDVTDRLGDIRVPTRVIVGSEDPVTPPAVGRGLADGIPTADLVVLDGASHIANVTRPDEFDNAVLEHLEKHL